MKRLVLLQIILISLCFLSYSDEARKVLAVYNSLHEGKYENANIHLHAEYVLNYMGLIVEPWDIASGIPEHIHTDDYLAVFCWFESIQLPHAEAFINWLHRVVDKKIKLIIWNNISVFKDQTTGKEVPVQKINSLLQRIGITFKGNYNENPLLIDIVYLDKKMMEFERSIDNELQMYEQLVSTSPKNKVFMKIKLKNRQNSTSDYVVTSPQGGIIWGNNILFRHVYYDPIIKKETTLLQWRVNPFLFFETILQRRHEPKMDVCVRNGRRIYYSHIDGDGFTGLSHVKAKATCGQIIKDEILKKYRLPVSVSFITCEIDPDYYGNASRIDMLKKIVALPNVEAASHTFSHPFVWSEKQKFEFKDTYEQFSLPIKNYTFNAEREIRGSIEYINSLIKPLGKTCSLLFWSGNCQPEFNALKIIEENSYRSINGGEPRYDRKFNSFAHLSPMGKKTGDLWQIYTSNCNETIYTNGWENQFSGIEKVIETFKNTNNQMCYRPMNIYYHFYSGEKVASTRALQKVYDYVYTQKINPVFTSEYIDIVKGFFSTKIRKTAHETWEIVGNGQCRTVRFDQYTKKPDLIESQNIIGYTYIKNKLYISLGKEKKSIIKLIPKNIPQNTMWVKSTNTSIKGIKKNGQGLFVEFLTWQDPEFDFGGCPSNTMSQILIKGNVKKNKLLTKSDTNGNVTFTVPGTKTGSTYLIYISFSTSSH